MTDIKQRMTNYRWVICGMLFFATAVNYLDRQVLSLTWKDFIAPEFHWTDTHYGQITAIFSLVYAIANVFAGRFVDWMGTKRGYLWAIALWSVGACLHALCGWATEHTVGLSDAAAMVGAGGAMASTIAIVSVYYFIAARVVLGIGEAGNFPAAVKATTEYFPKKDRAFATSIFNAGTTVGALIAPLCIPTLARYFQRLGVGNGWEMAFLLIGALGFVWTAVWVFAYKKPDENPHVNAAELAYIRQDDGQDATGSPTPATEERKLTFLQCIRLRQTWAFTLGKFLSDGVWWFLLFWTPAYISDVYGYTSDTPTAQLLLFVLYAITLLSILGGKLPTFIINRTGGNPYESRMKAMLVFAVIPLIALVAQPLGNYSYWWPILIIGLVAAAHQSWSANMYSLAGDIFPRNTVATITGMTGMAGGLSSFIINLVSGRLFDYAEATQMAFLGFEGKEAGYFIVFCYCAVAYLLGWTVMKVLVPRYKPVKA